MLERLRRVKKNAKESKTATELRKIADRDGIEGMCAYIAPLIDKAETVLREVEKANTLIAELAAAKSTIEQLKAAQAVHDDVVRNLRSQIYERAQQHSPTGTDQKGYFRALGLQPDVFAQLPEQQARRLVNVGYQVMSWVNHPDHGGTNDKMRRLNQAKEVLSDPLQRADYIRSNGS